VNAAKKPTAGELFGTSSRAKGLGGKLPPRRHQIHDPLADEERVDEERVDEPAVLPETEARPEPRTSTEQKANKAPRKSKPKPQPKPAAPATGDGSSSGEQDERESNENYQVYVPADVIARFRKRRIDEGTTNGELFMDAVDYAIDLESDDPYQLLRELVAKTLVGGGGEKPSLFKREPKRVKTPPIGTVRHSRGNHSLTCTWLLVHCGHLSDSRGASIRTTICPPRYRVLT
jgi:hypothetical protein